MTVGEAGRLMSAAGTGGLSHVKRDPSAGWSSGVWGLVVVLVIAALIVALVISVRRGSSSDDDE